MKKVIVFAALSVAFATSTIAQTPTDELKQMTAQLQSTSWDTALREKIIKHALTMSPPSVVPEEAERFMARGIAAMKDAKSEAGFREAAIEFKKAVTTAPWYADAYYNLGLAQSKARNYEGAMNNLKLYLLAAPQAADAKTAKGLIYEAEYQRERVYSRFSNVPFRFSSNDRSLNSFNGGFSVEGTFEGLVLVTMGEDYQRVSISLSGGSLLAIQRSEKIVSISPFLAETSGNAWNFPFKENYPGSLDIALTKGKKHSLGQMAFGIDGPPGLDLSKYWLGFEIRMLCDDGKPECTTYAHSSRTIFSSR